MAAGIYDITVEQGATFRLEATWKDSTGALVNLTGYSARMQIRETYESEDIILAFTSTGGSIVLGGALGTIVVTGTATDTAKVPMTPAVYDLELENAGVVTRLLQGRATITQEVTR
jgi:hypothetical protein